MDTKEFLQRILSPSGIHMVAVLDGNFFRHKGFTDIDEMAKFISLCDKRGLPTYHACASYKEKPHRDASGKLVSRKSVNWLSAKAFWCDIDCGAKKAEKGIGYATQREGAIALLTWCKSHNIPEPMIVSSGYGVHAYWPLTEALPPSEWVKAASALKQMFANDGLLVDPSRTSDFASVLRPVGSHNRKDPSNPKQVKLVRDCADIDTMTMLSAIMQCMADSGIMSEEIPSWLSGESAEGLVTFTEVPSSIELCAKSCRQVAIMRDTKGDVGYDHWRGVIGLIAHSTEGIEKAHEWTARRAETGHSNIDVDTRYNTWGSAPTTCEFFQKCNPEGCSGCPHMGKIKTPLVLGRKAPEPQAEEAVVVVEGDTTEKEVVVAVPELPQGFSWDGSQMIRFVKDKDGILQPHAFSSVRFYLTGRVRNALGTFEFLARAHLPNNIVREFSIPGSIAGVGGSKLIELLGGFEIIATTAKDAVINMSAYIKECVFKLMHEVAVTNTYTTFGWQNDSFLLGTRLFQPNGKTVESLLTGYASDKRSCFPRPRGSVEAYAKQLNWIYNRKGMQPMQYMICSLWGSLLVDMCEPLYKGIPVALTGTSSGKGKTTAGIAALYAFGDASELTVAGKNGSTTKAQAAFLGALQSIPVLFDEVTSMDPKTLSQLCYAVSNGVEPQRLKSTGGGGVTFAKRESWRLQSALTANTFLGAQLGLNGNTEAEAMRVFEIRIDKYNVPKLDPVQVSTAIAELGRNMGCAGEAFIKHLVEHRSDAVAELNKTHSWVSGTSKNMLEPKYRFFRQHMACTLTAAKIMKNLGVIDFDLAALKDFAVSACEDLFEMIKENNSTDCDSTLSQMLSDMSPRIITTLTYSIRMYDEPYKVNAPQGICGRAIRASATKKDEFDGKLFLSATEVRQWCITNRVDMDVLAADLKTAGVLIARDKRMTLGKSTTVSSARQRCWEIDINKIESELPFGESNG